MVKVRPKVVVDAKYESQTSYTINLDLPETGKLSTLFLKVAAKTTSTGNCPSPWMKYLISSISVNQAGQAALNAAPPEVFAADYYYKTGKMPQMGYQRPGGVPQRVEEIIPIMFGEKINDFNHYIDLGKLADPKLSVTYNLAETDHAGSTVWDTSYYPRFTVLTNLFQGAGLSPSKGYHSLRQSELYTPANSEKHLLELKGQRPIKRLYHQYDATDPNETIIHMIDRIRITGKNEEWIPFDITVWEYTELIRNLYGICEIDALVSYAKGGQYLDLAMDMYLGGTVRLPATQLVHSLIQDASGRRGTLKYTTRSSGANSTAAVGAEYNLKGLAPWSVYPIDMPKMLEIDYLDPNENSPVFLEVTHNAGAGGYSAPSRIHTLDLVTAI